MSIVDKLYDKTISGPIEITVPSINIFFGSRSFEDCTGITSVKVHYANKNGSELFSFQRCTNLVSAELMKAEWLSLFPFKNCTALRSVKLPSIKTLGGTFNNESTPFAYCPNLKVIELGSSVTKVQYFTYYGADKPERGRCENLIIKNPTPPTLYSYVSMTPVTNIYVPDESVDAYKSAPQWSNANVVGKIHPLSEYVEEE